VKGSTPSKHMGPRFLALYSRGDLPWRARFRVRRHVRNCETCQRQVALLQASTAELRREAETQTLTGFEAIVDWSRLEREMIGNIAVGVAAARCIDHVGNGRKMIVRVAFATGLAVLFAAGWATHIPREQTERILTSIQHWGARTSPSTGTILQSSPEGVAVRAQGSTLTMMHPRSAVVSVSSTSIMEARYIDSETGQVTITSVYAQ
jgi:hypothetical protein